MTSSSELEDERADMQANTLNDSPEISNPNPEPDAAGR